MQNKPNTTESLAAKRHPTRENAVVEVQGRIGKVFCKMNNLSKTGAFFEIINSNFSPKEGDLVKVTINLKQVNKTHTLHGHVVWNKGAALGVAFVKNKDDSKDPTK